MCKPAPAMVQPVSALMVRAVCDDRPCMRARCGASSRGRQLFSKWQMLPRTVLTARDLFLQPSNRVAVTYAVQCRDGEACRW